MNNLDNELLARRHMHHSQKFSNQKKAFILNLFDKNINIREIAFRVGLKPKQISNIVERETRKIR